MFEDSGFYETVVFLPGAAYRLASYLANRMDCDIEVTPRCDGLHHLKFIGREATLEFCEKADSVYKQYAALN